MKLPMYVNEKLSSVFLYACEKPHKFVQLCFDWHLVVKWSQILLTLSNEKVTKIFVEGCKITEICLNINLRSSYLRVHFFTIGNIHVNKYKTSIVNIICVNISVTIAIMLLSLLGSSILVIIIAITS